MLKPLAAAAALLLFLSCTPDSVTRAEWQAMSAHDRVVYVNSLIGAEHAKDAKGGQGRRYDKPATEYVARIDAAYAHGDRRDANVIFAELAP